MDTVIFTGRMTVEELKTERPREFREMKASGELVERLTEPLPQVVVRGIRIFGAVALTIGLSLILLVINAEIFSH